MRTRLLLERLSYAGIIQSRRTRVFGILFCLVVAGLAWQRWHAPHGDVVFATSSTLPEVQEAYRFAKERPDILANIGCSCGCMSNHYAHKSNLDCFKSDHAEVCPVCRRTALTAKSLSAQGKSPQEIQEAVERMFRFDMNGPKPSGQGTN